MFKKLFLTMACLMAAVTVFAAPGYTFSQSTKEAAAESFLGSMAFKDYEGNWKLLAPDAIKALMKEEKIASVDAAKKFYIEAMKESMDADTVKMLQEVYKNPEMKKGFVDEMLKKSEKAFVKINGKWYIDLSKTE